MAQRRTGRRRTASASPSGWGGRRPGAGRKPRPGRRPVPHRRRLRFRGYRPVHVTVHMIDEVGSLRRSKLAKALCDAFAAASRRGFRLCHFSVQRNHIHFIIEAASADALARGVQGLKVRIARKLNPQLGRKGTVFAERYQAELLDSPARVREALCHVLQNARRHGLHGPGTRWVVDPFSSGRYFDGWRQQLPRGLSPTADEGAWPVVRPKTWLLETGWRRQGLIGVDEMPAAGLRQRGSRSQAW